MIRIVRLSMISVQAIALLLGPSFADSKPAAGLPLSDLVRQVKVALLRVNEDAQNQNLPPLDSAELVLKSNLIKSIDGKLNFYIVEVGANSVSQVVSTIALTLKPPKPNSPSDVAAASLSDEIAEAILAGSQAIAAAGQGNPPLLAAKLVVEVDFTLKRDGTGRVGIDFTPVKIGGGGGIASEAVQTIKVTYALPSIDKLK